jgi:hypothetical protein
VREPDEIGVAGKIWHLRRKKKTDKLGNLAMSIAAIPGGNPQGAWLAIILREFKKKRKFIPTKDSHPLTAFEFIIAVLPNQAQNQTIDLDLSLHKYPEESPIAVLVQFGDMNATHALEIFDTAIRILMSGNLMPNSTFSHEWQFFLHMVAQQVQEESQNSVQEFDINLTA